MWAYQGVRNFSFTESSGYLLNGWPLTLALIIPRGCPFLTTNSVSVYWNSVVERFLHNSRWTNVIEAHINNAVEFFLSSFVLALSCSGSTSTAPVVIDGSALSLKRLGNFAAPGAGNSFILYFFHFFLDLPWPQRVVWNSKISPRQLTQY